MHASVSPTFMARVVSAKPLLSRRRRRRSPNVSVSIVVIVAFLLVVVERPVAERAVLARRARIGERLGPRGGVVRPEALGGPLAGSPGREAARRGGQPRQGVGL